MDMFIQNATSLPQKIVMLGETVRNKYSFNIILHYKTKLQNLNK